MTGVLPVDIRRCARRKTNGIPCGSPALKDKPYCYFHDRWREQHIDVLDGTPYYQNADAELPVLEDANHPDGPDQGLPHAARRTARSQVRPVADLLFERGRAESASLQFAPEDEELGDNAPARPDQSIGQANALTPRPEKTEWNMSAREKEDAAIAAKKAGCPTSRDFRGIRRSERVNPREGTIRGP